MHLTQKLRSMVQFMTMVRPLRLLHSWRDCTGYLPLEVTLWLTYRCNAHCSFCIFTNEKNRREALSAGELSLEQIYRILDNLAALGTRRIMITGGEPTLRDDLVDIVAYATGHKIRTGIFTNGSLLNHSLTEGLVAAGIDTICISLDAADTALHDSLRNVPGLGEKVLAALAHVDETRKRLGRRMKLATNTVVTARNYRQLDRIVELKADFDFDHATFVTLVEFEGLPVPELRLSAEDREVLHGEVIPRLHEKARCYGLPVSVLAGETPQVTYQDTYCFSPWLYAEILPSGNVVVCDRSASLGLRFGSVMHESFSDIWNGEKLRAFRRTCRPPQHEMCRRCTFHIDRNQKLMRFYGLVPGFIRPLLEGKPAHEPDY
jgi:radical SAM protein with 4Fe4S-binding SPASM domain